MTRIYLLTLGLLSGLVSAQEWKEKQLDLFMDEWHLAAARADAEGFFGKMAADAIYIGTDVSERWLRDELRIWAKSAFESNSAWTFTAKARNWQFLSSDLAIADEVLETWMGLCRSTVVLKKNGPKEWKIHHYQLSVTVPNEKIEAFIALMEQ